MSVKRTQREVDSLEFTEWMAFYRLADGREEEREPTPDELGLKLRAWAEMQKGT